jgi:uncharacterized protein GlcG (DUF336 family)
VASPAAVIAAMPKNLPRAPGPGLSAALAAAEAAERLCAAKGVHVSVLVADTTGQPVVLLSGDGAGVRSALITHTKAAIVAKYGQPSGEVAARAATDQALVDEAAADPDIGVLRGGGFPVLKDGRLTAIVAVSGGSRGDDHSLDDLCAREGVARLSR